jgi:prevent-host-death family protein
MLSTTFTSREFSHKAGLAKNAAAQGPVFITDRGRPKFVLLAFEDYQLLKPKAPKLSDLIALDDESFDAFDFEFKQASGYPVAANLL